jgi:diaminohydroxyphosphoribosylaminopyrimidine deaminase / 5-amino-6-(5-phosphoribosylamino)uracil reductase
MRRALRLAAKAKGRTSPNPMVGAVLVRGGRVVGEGYHTRAGEPHAEIVALSNAKERARGSTLYLNLEPCAHQGRTPPCAPVVARSGVKRAVIGMEDPNPRVKGKGIRALERAGVKVRLGVMEEECRRLNEAFCKHITTGLPFVILKAAATLDGKIATRNGDSKWISSEASRRLVHRLRNEVDGIIVGIGTILKDNPLLTARIPGGKDPYRIILDAHLGTPESAQVIGTLPSKTILITTEKAPREKVKRLLERGVQVWSLGSVGGKVDLKMCLAKLGEMGMMSLLVEGGSRIYGSFLDEGLADKLILFLAPRLMGDAQALSIFGGRGVGRLQEAALLKDMRLKRVGGDVVIEGYIKKGTELCSREL